MLSLMRMPRDPASKMGALLEQEWTGLLGGSGPLEAAFLSCDWATVLPLLQQAAPVDNMHNILCGIVYRCACVMFGA